MNDYGQNRLVVVSNRLPIILTRPDKDELQVETGSGGLVTALAPVLKNRGGLWIGWPGITGYDIGDIERILESESRNAGYTFKPVGLTDEEQDKFYKGFSNEIIWPLFHDFPSYCIFNPEYWNVYKQVNRKFAEVIAQNTGGTDFIWVHDYHLMVVAKQLRELNPNSRIAFFQHIPFPPLDIFVRLPWRFQILRALLDYDLLGFQTIRDRRNFIQCVRMLIKDINIKGKGQVITARYQGREIRIGNIPNRHRFYGIRQKCGNP